MKSLRMLILMVQIAAVLLVITGVGGAVWFVIAAPLIAVVMT